jgi:hypothetical protein
MERLENTMVTAGDQLAKIYGRPSERVLRKEIDHIDTVGRAFIAASPFLVLATGSSRSLWLQPSIISYFPGANGPRSRCVGVVAGRCPRRLLQSDEHPLPYPATRSRREMP